jgi:hypothetical protein
MGGQHSKLFFWLGLALTAGLVLALMRADLAYIVRPAIGLMMIAAGLFFIFGRMFEGPAAPDVERIFRRHFTGLGVGQVLFGISQLLPMGWGSTACMFLAAVVMPGTWLATRREMAALAPGPQG